MDHHYVPQFYTARWADDGGTILRYRRVTSERVAAKGVSPKGTGFEPDLYATPAAVFWEESDENIIETAFFSRIDNDGAKVLARLENGATGLTEAERSAWALFLNSMRYRHRDDILARDAAAPAAIEELKAKWLAARSGPEERERFLDALADVDLDQLARNSHRTVMAQQIRNLGELEAIKSLFWEVVVVNAELPLITTDRPVLINLGNGRSPMEILTMPLSPTRLFVAYPGHWRGPDGTCIEGVDEFVERVTFAHYLLLLNEQQCRFVYATKRLDDVVTDGRVLRMGVAVEEALKRWPE